MQVESLSICDHAQDYAGKMTVLGSFDTIWMSSIPAIYPHFAVAARIRFDASEAGDHMVTISCINEDGGLVGPKFQNKVRCAIPEGASSGSVNMVIVMSGFKFPAYGTYHYDLLVNGDLKARVPLFVKAAKAQPQKVA